MTIEILKNKIPDYAKDIKLNLTSLLGGSENVQLTNLQVTMIAIASAYASREKSLIQLLEQYAIQQSLTIECINAAKSAASLMAMNNVYYRSVHWVHHDKYVKLPSNLRMQMLKKHGVNQQDFELCCTAISAINGCERCVDSHVSLLEKEGIGTAEIHYTLRLASVIQALAQVMIIESALV